MAENEILQSTAVDTANALVECLRSEHELKNIPLVDIATLYHKN